MLSAMLAGNMNFSVCGGMGRHRVGTVDILNLNLKQGFKTILIFIKICSSELEFYITLPLTMMSLEVVESVKFLRIPRARMLYKLRV